MAWFKKKIQISLQKKEKSPIYLYFIFAALNYTQGIKSMTFESAACLSDIEKPGSKVWGSSNTPEVLTYLANESASERCEKTHYYNKGIVITI